MLVKASDAMFIIQDVFTMLLIYVSSIIYYGVVWTCVPEAGIKGRDK